MDRTLNELAARVAHGDKNAYSQLLRESAKLIRGYIHARVSQKDRSAVEDIVQDTLLAIHTKYQSYDPAMPFVPWLRTIAHHKLIDHWRRQKIAFLVTLDNNDDAMQIAAPETGESTNAALTLEKLFEKLSDKQKRIVQLARLDGKSMAYIAAEMSISVSDVKVTLHRALIKLSSFAGSHANG